MVRRLGSADSSAATVPDIMSYCQSGFLPTKWISPYRWQNLFTNFTTVSPAFSVTAAAAVLPPTPTFYIVGAISITGAGKLDPVFTQPGFATPIGMEGAYSLELLDAKGQPLLVHRFNVEFLDEEGVQQKVAPFNFYLPAVQGVAAIALKFKGDMLDRIVISPHAPTVQVLRPFKGEQLGAHGFVSWEASDADGDALTFNILFSGDGGKTWKPLVNSLPDKTRQYDFDTSRLMGSNNALMRVIASDGANTTSADSDPFIVPDQPPQATIALPVDGTKFTEGQLIQFKGSALDPEEGQLADDHLLWSYRFGQNGNFVQFGVGSDVQAALPVGVLTIRLTGIDTTGQEGFAEESIEVLRDTDGDGIPDITDNCILVPNPDQRDTDGDGYGNACDGDLNNDGIVNALDVSIFKQRIGSSDPDADLNGDGIVNALDVSIFKSLIGKKPGPSGLRPSR